jgi:hypothetical protein
MYRAIHGMHQDSHIHTGCCDPIPSHHINQAHEQSTSWGGRRICEGLQIQRRPSKATVLAAVSTGKPTPEYTFRLSDRTANPGQLHAARTAMQSLLLHTHLPLKWVSGIVSFGRHQELVGPMSAAIATAEDSPPWRWPNQADILRPSVASGASMSLAATVLRAVKAAFMLLVVCLRIDFHPLLPRPPTEAAAVLAVSAAARCCRSAAGRSAILVVVVSQNSPETTLSSCLGCGPLITARCCTIETTRKQPRSLQTPSVERVPRQSTTETCSKAQPAQCATNIPPEHASHHVSAAQPDGIYSTQHH